MGMRGFSRMRPGNVDRPTLAGCKKIDTIQKNAITQQLEPGFFLHDGKSAHEHAVLLKKTGWRCSSWTAG